MGCGVVGFGGEGVSLGLGIHGIPMLGIGMIYPPGPTNPIRAILSSSDRAPGLGVPGGTAGPIGGVGIGGGPPIAALGITSGGNPGVPIGGAIPGGGITPGGGIIPGGGIGG